MKFWKHNHRCWPHAKVINNSECVLAKTLVESPKKHVFITKTIFVGSKNSNPTISSFFLKTTTGSYLWLQHWIFFLAKTSVRSSQKLPFFYHLQKSFLDQDMQKKVLLTFAKGNTGLQEYVQSMERAAVVRKAECLELQREKGRLERVRLLIWHAFKKQPWDSGIWYICNVLSLTLSTCSSVNETQVCHNCPMQMTLEPLND